jgi:GNAT superfamily N-acetyltransferase
MRLQALTGAPQELDRVDELLRTAYGGSSRRTELALYLATQPDGWFALVVDDRPVAVAGALAYGSFCWIGLVATHPDHGRRGLATTLSAHLIDWARDHGCETIALDASDAGRQVYERLGFRPIGETVELVTQPGPSPARHGSPRRLEGEPPRDLFRLDRETFGGDREGLLRCLLADAPSCCYVVPSDHRVDGYLVVRDGLIGPGCASDPPVADMLIRAALADAGERAMLVPAGSAHLATLKRLGLHERRRLTHMRHGNPRLPGRRTRLLAQTSFAAG